MISTKSIVAGLRRANPDKDVNEDLIRRALRQGLVPAPAQVAGRYIWTPAEVRQLSAALNLREPEELQSTTDALAGSQDPGV